MGQDRRVAIHVITSTFRVIITTDTPEGDRRGISFHPKRVFRRKLGENVQVGPFCCFNKIRLIKFHFPDDALFVLSEFQNLGVTGNMFNSVFNIH